MEKILKDVIIAATVLGGIKVYGELKRIQGIVEATRIINEEHVKILKQRKKHFNYYNEMES